MESLSSHQEPSPFLPLSFLPLYSCDLTPLTWNSFIHTGQPGWQSLVGCAAASPEPWELRVPHSHSKLLQGGTSGARCGAWGAASPATTWEHLAASKGAVAPAVAALCLPAGCPAGNRKLHCIQNLSQAGKSPNSPNEVNGSRNTWSMNKRVLQPLLFWKPTQINCVLVRYYVIKIGSHLLLLERRIQSE